MTADRSETKRGACWKRPSRARLSRRQAVRMHNAVLHFFDYVNAIVLVYFLVTNVVYTVLMVLSLYSVTMHAKSAAHGAYADLLESPVTPPVALIVPAHNEEDGIVQTVMSLLEIQYPEKEVIVVDDGSTDGTVERLVQQFHLLRMDLIFRPVANAEVSP